MGGDEHIPPVNMGGDDHLPPVNMGGDSHLPEQGPGGLIGSNGDRFLATKDHTHVGSVG